MFQEILNQVMPHIVSIVTVIVGAMASWIAYKANTFLQKQKLKQDNELANTIIDKVVAYVDQKLTDATNEEKFQEASKRAAEWLSSKNIKVSSAELEIMIEAAVNGAHKGLNQPMEILPLLEQTNIEKEVEPMEENKENEKVQAIETVDENEVGVEVVEESTLDQIEADEPNVENPAVNSEQIDEESKNEVLEEGQG